MTKKPNIEQIIEYVKSDLETRTNSLLREASSHIHHGAFGLAGMRYENAREVINEANNLGVEIKDYSTQINELKQEYKTYWIRQRGSWPDEKWH